MKPLPAIARLCALLLSLTALGCSSEFEDDPGSDTGGSAGSTVSKGGSSGSSAASRGGGGAGGGASSTQGTSVASAGASAGAGGATASSFNPAAAGLAGLGIGTGGAPVGTAGAGPSYSISGTVTGLSGTGLSLSLSSGTPLKAVATFPITGDGAFTSPIQLASGSNVVVGVASQPSAPQQTCTVSASGTVASLAGNITDIVVTCATNGHAIGGTITGLTGSGLVLLSSTTGDELAMGGNGRFAFPTKILSGQPFTVTVKSQPIAPNQTCSVSGGSGTTGPADVTSVTVNCSTNTYSIGGTVTGLAGSGLTLLNNGVDQAKPSANGSFAFPTPVVSGGAFAVTIQTQPSEPAQTCTLVSATGTVANGNVSSIGVACVTNTYAVGGSVTGLVGGGLTLQNNLGDNLAIAADGQFSFATKLPSGTNYSVTVQAPPTSPTQECTVADGNGTTGTSDVSSVKIACVTKTYAVGGTVSGMVGTGLVLRNNGGDSITVNANGAFTFPTKVPSGQPFAVTIFTLPTGEVCSTGGDHGTIGSADISSVRINCSDTAYMIGGTVTGLVGTGLQLALNDKAPEPVTTNTYAFSDLLVKNDLYTVTIAQQPSNPWQTCALTNATGTVTTSDISDVDVTCTTNTYTVGGNVTGLAGTGLVLQNNAGDDVPVSADGSFTFATQVSSGRPYAVTVLTQPTSPAQTCAVTNAGGSVGGSNITNVQVTCTTNAYSIAGTISGLAGSVTLANNTTDTLSLTANGPFSFPTKLASGTTYTVTVTAQPMTPAQECTVTSGSGTVATANVTNVSVVCVTKLFTVGGTVTGLASGQAVVLQNNAGDNRTVSADGTFTFATSIASGGTYAVTVLSSPTAQACTVSGGNGTVGSSNVTSISVNCSSLRTVGGTISGLAGSGLVLRNGTENLPVSGTATFAFKTLYANGSTYNVTVQSQPTSPWQTCAVSGGTGTVNGDVTTVVVTCTSNPYTVNVNVTGLTGAGLVLQNNNADNLAVPGNGVRPFTTKVLSGQPYSVRVLTQPSAPVQTCTVSAGTGSIGNADVTVNVTCASNSYTIGGTVYGYIGTGLTLQNNGGNNLSISSTGTFTFTTKVASGTAYAVTVASHPTGFRCAVSSGTGTVGSGNVTSVSVSCPAYTFDVDAEGWFVKNGSAGLTLNNTVGTPTLGALQYQPATASCSQVGLEVNPAQRGITLDARGKALSLWVRFDTFPSNPVSGNVVLYAQDAGWGWYATTFPISSFTIGAWKQLTLPAATSGNWASVQAIGVRIEGVSPTCQATKMYIDSVQLR